LGSATVSESVQNAIAARRRARLGLATFVPGRLDLNKYPVAKDTRRRAVPSRAITRAVGVALLLNGVWASAVHAQQRDTTGAPRALQAVRVTVSRETSRSVLDLPFGVSRLSTDSTRAGIRRASLTELLIGVPGLAVSNRHNPTQDPRLAVRGFGARSAFGIRGVRVVRDGVPLTLADGQTAVDFVDLEGVGSAEVMRGAAGALYGNASGGVLELKSDPFPLRRFAPSVRYIANADAVRWTGTAAGTGRDGSLGWRVTATGNNANGPRDYAEFRSSNVTADAAWRGEQGSVRTQFTRYDSPTAENPGAVTAAELRAVPAVADSQNILRQASKAVGQKLLSVVGERRWDAGSASATVFSGWRDLYNPQAFAIVGFDRRTLGASGRLEQRGLARNHLWRVTVGADVQSQRDDRRNWNNCAGRVGAGRPASTCPTAANQGTETIHQLEKVASAGLFARGEVNRSFLTVTGTLRGDQTAFSVRDFRTRTIGGAIQSRTMSAFTPMLGASFRVRPTLALYTNLASSFETPTTTELANRPDGSAGLNRELQPQRGGTLEAGLKGVVARYFFVDVALFDIRTRDELIPFEIPNSGGRRYFRNAGETRRRGAELGVTASFGGLDVGGALTAIDYTYEDYRVGTTVLDGNKVPGVAPTSASLFATARRAIGFVTVEMQQAARTAADDANANYAPGWVLWNARMGLTALRASGVEPVIGIDNLLDRHYAANIVTNATRGRFFEPGAGRRVYLSLRVGR
jgi:iron complex outermembrane receptor protein